MKNFKTKFLGLALAGLILGACSQTGTYETADLMNEQAVANKAGFKMTPFGMGNANASILTCGECVAEPVIQDFITTKNNNNNYADVEVWNDMDKLYLKVTANDSKTMDEIQLSYPFSSSLNGQAKNCNYNIQYNHIFNNNSVPFTTHTFEFPLGVYETDWNKCDLESFALRVAGISGQPVFLQGPDGTEENGTANPCTNVPAPVSYALHEICSGCDEASFDYETEDNKNITFTYNHGEEVESLTIVFTFPQVLDVPLNENGDYVALGGKIYSVNNPTNQTVFTWTGAVSCKASEAETFEFSMSPDCGKGKDGKANIWTDAKIIAIDGVDLVDDLTTLDVNEGPYSLKGDLANIVSLDCN